MSHTLFELDVRLREIEPPIWRTVEVPGASSLEDVHFAIQVAMGWTNSHLHQFDIGNKHYGMVDVDDAPADLEDEREYRLEDLVQKGRSFVYEYDFGDGWEHDVTVKKITTVAKLPRPRCVAGARACPPEDCGGPFGYQNLLEALADPDHKDHETLVEWAPPGFKPERFALPKNGLDLQEEMSRLQALASGDDEQDAEDGASLALPQLLVDAVLALEPMQRASLAAVIAGSLASELEHARSLVAQPATTTRATTARTKKPPRHGRGRRARS